MDTFITYLFLLAGLAIFITGIYYGLRSIKLI
uniref:Cytochrome b6-f complex subunit 6 n=2 Tax=Pavlovaceae TaxID=418969 RepID=M1K3S4_DIALT|nr:cytochrome b6-f complex subunit 6 [Diacronema lutheri]YP_009863779.1 cytochrome b6-f complex subunit 6 [Pavlova sp. NIVA-4/92]AGE93756.1 cytochrome b6-f complex subunit 6 [Diacronema lutheri]QKE31110.1 cytochrome b6-f complex subunit 6 [Pavlova sp. NIVA-4/92]